MITSTQQAPDLRFLHYFCTAPQLVQLGSPVLTEAEILNIGTLGVFVHLHYPELADEAARQLLVLEPPIHVHVSTDCENKACRIREDFAFYGFDPGVRVLPNRGLDIAPFLIGFADKIPQYQFIFRLHGKRSLHLPGDLGDHWRHMAYDALAGSRRRARAVLRSFMTHPRLGMAAAPDFYYFADGPAIGNNRPAMDWVLNRLGLTLPSELPDEVVSFPMGSMFWCRSLALQPFLDLKLSFDEFSSKAPADRDGTLAHALERCFFYACALQGLEWTKLPFHGEVNERSSSWYHERIRLRGVKKRLLDTLSSTSWRMTAPLRKLRDLLAPKS